MAPTLSGRLGTSWAPMQARMRAISRQQLLAELLDVNIDKASTAAFSIIDRGMITFRFPEQCGASNYSPFKLRRVRGRRSQRLNKARLVFLHRPADRPDQLIAHFPNVVPVVLPVQRE
jgi:hypothetical protein